MTRKKRKILAMFKPRFEDQQQRLENMFDVISVKSPDEAQDVINSNQDIVAIFSVIGRPVTANLMKSLPNLEIIASFGVGYDHIDLEAAKAREIVVTNTPDVVTEDTADTALALMLNVSRRFVEGDVFVRVGKWPTSAKPVGQAITGKTVGILGLGRIGKAIARRCEAFGMDVIYTARSEKPDEPYMYFKTAEALAKESHFLVVSCPGGPTTTHLVNRKILTAIGPQGYLINIARGSVVDTEDLIWALEQNVIAGAGLDVFENEPFVPEELIRRDNVVLLPHMGTATQEVLRAQGDMVLDHLEAYFNGNALKARVV